MKDKISFISNLLRIKQWTKNSFIFFPVLFGGKILDLNYLGNTLITFGGFCLIASGLYILNDFLDIEKDRLHPKKSKRALAKSNFKTPTILLLIAAFIGIELIICYKAGLSLVYVGLAYIFIHLAYNFLIKNVVILDVIFIALGFQVRIWAGAFAVDIPPSIWLQMCVFILALFLGFNKRRHELDTLKDKAADHRTVLSEYTAAMLDQIIMICATLAIAFYGLYTISSDIMARVGNHNMVYSVGFVIYGIFRYLYLVHVKKLGDEPGEVLASDYPLLGNILFWIFYVGILIY